ncbi:Transposase [Dorea longicatena]|nr:Transposase [Dorea longicatena]
MLGKITGYGYKKIGFILDRGYFSRGNIRYLDECGYSFVIMAKGMSSFISDLILENKGTFENKRSCDMNAYGVYGKTVQRTLFEGDEKKRYIHIYHSISKDADEREHFENALRERTALLMSHQNETVEFGSAYEKYFYLHYDKDGVFLYPEEKTTVTEREISLCGYFVIITSERMTAKLTGMNVSVISHMCAGTQKRFNKKTIQKLESVLEISIPDISNDAEAIIKDMEEGQTI